MLYTRADKPVVTSGTFTATGRPFESTRKEGDNPDEVSKVRYNAVGQTTRTVAPTGAARAYGYDAGGRQTTLVELDGENSQTGPTTEVIYKQNTDLVAVVRYPGDNGTTVHDRDTAEYDDLGRLVTSTDVYGREVTRTYERLGQVKTVTSPDHTNDVAYQYDDLGRLAQITDRTGTRDYVYQTNTGYLEHVTTTFTDMPGAPRTISYGYNTGTGARTWMRLPVGDGTVLNEVRYTYDGSRLQAVRGATGRTTTWGYRDDGVLQTQTTGNVLETEILRNRATGRVESYANYRPDERMDEYSTFGGFSYDDRKRLTGYTIGAFRAPAGFALSQPNRTFRYNTDGRLIYDSIYAGGLEGDREWAYDARGNITHFPSSGEDLSRAHDDKNRWRGFGTMDNLVDGDLFVYDNTTMEVINNELREVTRTQGNPTTYKGRRLVFDPDCQLLEFWGDETGPVPPTNPIFRADYRADGHRAWKEVRGDNGEGDPERTYYLYDGDNPVVELDAQGRTTAIMTWGLLGLISRDVRGADGTYRGVLYAFDPLGNVAQRLDATTGEVLSADEYDAYGTLVNGGDPADPYGYKAQHGYVTDHETGLLYCWHRYYDPAAGRWLTRDPIRHDGGVNLYEYCGGDPVGGVDASGLLYTDANGRADAGEGVGDIGPAGMPYYEIKDEGGGHLVMRVYRRVPHGLSWRYEFTGIRGNLETGVFYSGSIVVSPDGSPISDPAAMGPINRDDVADKRTEAAAIGRGLIRRHFDAGGHTDVRVPPARKNVGPETLQDPDWRLREAGGALADAVGGAEAIQKGRLKAVVDAAEKAPRPKHMTATKWRNTRVAPALAKGNAGGLAKSAKILGKAAPVVAGAAVVLEIVADDAALRTSENCTTRKRVASAITDGVFGGANISASIGMGTLVTGITGPVLGPFAPAAGLAAGAGTSWVFVKVTEDWQIADGKSLKTITKDWLGGE